MLAIPAIEAIVPTPFEEGVEKIREVIGKYSNLIMQRKILMTDASLQLCRLEKMGPDALTTSTTMQLRRWHVYQ